MSTRSCDKCPPLRAQVIALERQVAFLRQVLADTTAGVRATVEFIDQQTDTPTMPRRRLLPAVHTRLTYVLDAAEGHRV